MTGAQVFSGLYRQQEVAIKVLKEKIEPKQMEDFMREFEMMIQVWLVPVAAVDVPVPLRVVPEDVAVPCMHMFLCLYEYSPLACRFARRTSSSSTVPRRTRCCA